MGVIDSLIGLIKDNTDMKLFAANVPIPPVYNQGISISNIDTDSMGYAPQAYTQASAETAGTQNSGVINQDINVIGSFTAGAQFIDVTRNNLLDNGGIVVINPVITDRVAANLMYNGYNVSDGEIS